MLKENFFCLLSILFVDCARPKAVDSFPLESNLRVQPRAASPNAQSDKPVSTDEFSAHIVSTAAGSATPIPSGTSMKAGLRCSRDTECPFVRGYTQHHPCCEQEGGTGLCVMVTPKTDICRNRHLCLTDADCRGGGKCISQRTDGQKTCQNTKERSGNRLPGECYNRAPNTPPLPQCDGPMR